MMRKLTQDILDMIPVKFEDIIFQKYNPRSRNGIVNWELKIKLPNNKYKFIVIEDSVDGINIKEISVKKFVDKEERDKEIYTLYTTQWLSQLFLSEIFKLSQPSISLILKRQNENEKAKVC